jgi:molybdopterin synthase sulfur carrier subunit
MEVHFFATLRQITGQKTVEFDLPEGATTRELVDAIVHRFPPIRRELLDEDGELWPYVHIFINGRDAPFLKEGLDTVLTTDDTVNIFPPVAGG